MERRVALISAEETNTHIASKRDWPKPGDTAGWKKLMYGTTATRSSENDDSSTTESHAMHTHSSNITQSSTIPTLSTSTSPSTSLLDLTAYLSNTQTFSILKHQLHILSSPASVPTPLFFAWTFALLARVETPLFPEVSCFCFDFGV